MAAGDLAFNARTDLQILSPQQAWVNVRDLRPKSDQTVKRSLWI